MCGDEECVKPGATALPGVAGRPPSRRTPAIFLRRPSQPVLAGSRSVSSRLVFIVTILLLNHGPRHQGDIRGKTGEKNYSIHHRATCYIVIIHCTYILYYAIRVCNCYIHTICFRCSHGRQRNDY